MLHRNKQYDHKASRYCLEQLIYLADILVNNVGFWLMEIDECVSYRGKVLYVKYTDDKILAAIDLKENRRIYYQGHQRCTPLSNNRGIKDFLGLTEKNRR